MAEDKSGKMMKVMTFTKSGDKIGEWSQQLPVDPFKYSHGIQAPPFQVEQLVFIAESHPIHAAAIEQKTNDVVGTGWEYRPRVEDADVDQRKGLDAWLADLSSDDEMTTHELLLSTWGDVETVGWGAIELARDAQGIVRHWYHIPAHTTRFHRDGVRICQIRHGRRVWFKRWLPGDTRVVDRTTGAVKDSADEITNEVANEIIVLKRPSRRSSWYGIPTYVSAIGWISLSLAARDDNIMYFENRREPRWAVILSNLEDDPEMEEALHQAFKTDLKEPHRNIVIPIAGNGKIEFKQLSDLKGDMSFERLQARGDAAILVAHRIPSERLGMVKVGALGGDVAKDASLIYKEAVISTSQALMSARMNTFIETESPFGRDVEWTWHPEELDLTEEGQDLDLAVRSFTGNVLMLNEARQRVGAVPLPNEDPRGNKFYFELQGGVLPSITPPGVSEGDPTDPMRQEVASRIRAILEQRRNVPEETPPPQEPPQEPPTSGAE